VTCLELTMSSPERPVSGEVSIGEAGSLRVLKHGQTLGQRIHVQKKTLRRAGIPARVQYACGPGCPVSVPSPVAEAFDALLRDSGIAITDWNREWRPGVALNGWPSSVDR
jgi:hypothetical protein